LTDDRAFGADDVAGPLYNRQDLKKLRFLMTVLMADNIDGGAQLFRGTNMTDC
jgi:hypothetical protein